MHLEHLTNYNPFMIKTQQTEIELTQSDKGHRITFNGEILNAIP